MSRLKVVPYDGVEIWSMMWTTWNGPVPVHVPELLILVCLSGKAQSKSELDMTASALPRYSSDSSSSSNSAEDSGAYSGKSLVLEMGQALEDLI